MTDTPRCGAFQREPLFGTIHYCELAHGHGQSHQRSGGGWPGIWPRVKGDDASIAISRFEYDAMRGVLRWAERFVSDVQASYGTRASPYGDTVKMLSVIRAALAAAEGK